MKKILFTQRVDIVEKYDERRDCADQNVARLIIACGFLPFPIMNIPDMVIPFCEELKPDGILFTGGNDLASYGGDAPERDLTEQQLLKYALRNDIPIFGICRGMQMLADYYGIELEKVSNHIRTKHRISGVISRQVVNSYHGMGITVINEPLIEMARSEDGVIEAFKHRTKKVAAIMWHPERGANFELADIKLIVSFFEKGKIT